MRLLRLRHVARILVSRREGLGTRADRLPRLPARRKDPLFGLLFGLAQFQLGVAITPVIAPGKLLAAFVRGTHVRRDVCVDWQPWDDFDQPIEEPQKEFNILPRA